MPLPGPCGLTGTACDRHPVALPPERAPYHAPPFLQMRLARPVPARGPAFSFPGASGPAKKLLRTLLSVAASAQRRNAPCPPAVRRPLVGTHLNRRPVAAGSPASGRPGRPGLLLRGSRRPITSSGCTAPCREGIREDMAFLPGLSDSPVQAPSARYGQCPGQVHFAKNPKPAGSAGASPCRKAARMSQAIATLSGGGPALSCSGIDRHMIKNLFIHG